MNQSFIPPSWKQRFRQQTSFGSWLSLGHAGLAEILCQVGYDWLVIDMEHTGTDWSAVENMIRVTSLYGKPCLVRTSGLHENEIKKALDLGASGIIVPMINTKEQAEDVVRFAHYYPKGERGTGLYRAQAYGTQFQEYRKWAGEEVTVIAQIEHYRAVEQLNAITSVLGIDGILVGPYDLSASMGIPGDFESQDFRKMFHRVQEALTQNIMGGYHLVHPREDKITELLQAGFRFIALGVDFVHFHNAAQNSLLTARQQSQ